ncbi:response regulator [bacterium]|nr:response regulator [bacterium]
METRRKLNEVLLKKKQLLLVDDVKLFLHLSKAMLSREDFIVHTAINGEEALDIARKYKPDAILLDLYMPGMNGDEVCRKIRSEPATSHIPVIMITTESDGEGRSRCMYSGCDDFLTKPVRADILNSAVQKHLAVKERIHPRTGVMLPCILKSDHEFLKSTIHTISAGGAYVEMDPPPLPGSAHTLTFSLVDEQENISVRALARWNRMMHGERPVGSGFEFVEIGEDSFERLNYWVENTLDNPLFS